MQYLTEPRSIPAGRGTMNRLARALHFVFARRLRRTLPARMLSDHLVRDVGLDRVSGRVRRRAR